MSPVSGEMSTRELYSEASNWTWDKKADAYYWKGVNMMGKATLKGDKMVAPDGTAEAFNKYLELQPTGQFADPAKQMLASIGATVETNFGKKKASKK